MLNMIGFVRRQRWQLAALLILTFVLATGAAFTPSNVQAAGGGPVVLDGGDFPDHGFYSSGTLNDAWQYAAAAVTSIAPEVTRAGNDGSIAVLGSSISNETSGDTGGNYRFLAIVLDKTVNFHDGAKAINSFFIDLDAGAINPAIIVTAGTGVITGNDLDSTEGAALSDNALAIADFVNSGGGLIGHGSGDIAFGWLSTLLPGISFPLGCDSDTLSLTAEGQSAFPDLTNTDIRSGPCHGNFTGDLGTLLILAKDGSDRSIILGGASVILPGSIELDPPKASGIVGDTHTVTATVKDSNAGVLSGKTVSFRVSGANTIKGTGTSPSNGSGQVLFTYTGNNAGADSITASFVDDNGATNVASASMFWFLAARARAKCHFAGPVRQH